MSELDLVTVPDDIFELAQQRTGLTDIDSDSWREGLAIILDEVNSEPAFSRQGRSQIIDDTINALGRRLRIHNYIRTHPEVLDTPIERPLFIIGMPRTGTTVISNMLDQDLRRRSLLHWECMQPVPPPTTDTLRSDPRCLAMLEEQRQMLELVTAANMALPHWEDADSPTECMFIHNQDFKALSWDAYMATPRYAQWLIHTPDMTSTYEYQRRYLHVLQHHAPGTWTLKMPSHSMHIEALLKVFPDARLIWAHRDPYKASGSVGNLWKLPKSTVLNPEAFDPTTWGSNIIDQLQAHLQPALQVRDRIGADRFFDMYYHEMMADPMDVMRRIYDWAGDRLTSDTTTRMQQWLSEHPQNRFAPNKYNLEEYGLSVDMLAPVFADYLETFSIELEGPA